MRIQFKMLAIAAVFACATANAELVQYFKDPTFSGNGWSTQVLTLQQMQKAQKESIDAQKKAEQSQIDAAAQNTPSARFVALFTSQMYAQVATQLNNQLFNSCKNSDGTAIQGCNAAVGTGTIKLDDTTTVLWQKLDANGNIVTSTSQIATKVHFKVNGPGQNVDLTVPIASFGF
jgi:hypothetical protein